MINVTFVKNAVAYINSLINRDEEEGQGLVEYALILVLISVVAIAIMTTLGDNVSSVFSSVSDTLGG